jgi:hypothetical protein
MTDRWTRADDLIATDLDDELVLLNLSTRALFSLNATGRAVWIRLAAPATIAELVDAIVTTFAVDERVAARDIQSLLDKLAAAGLVRAA